MTSCSPITRVGAMSSGTFGHGRSMLAERALLRVLDVSPPHSTTRSNDPDWISRAVAFMRDCGLLPPMDVITVSRVEIPSSSAMNRAGSRYLQERNPTTRSESTSGIDAKPASREAMRIASAMKGAGARACSGSSIRCRCWPTPTMTGVRGSSAMREMYLPSVCARNFVST